MPRWLSSSTGLVLVAATLAGCSTGVREADRAIFVNACTGVSGSTDATCGCAFDQLSRSGSDRLLNDTIDELQRGQVPARLTRAIARCSQGGGGGS